MLFNFSLPPHLATKKLPIRVVTHSESGTTSNIVYAELLKNTRVAGAAVASYIAKNPEVLETLPGKRVPKISSGSSAGFGIHPDGTIVLLGTGTYGDVFLGLYKERVVALKLFKKTSSDMSVVLKEAAYSRVMSKAGCGPKYHGLVPLSDNPVYQPVALVMDYVGTGKDPNDLYGLINDELSRRRQGLEPRLTPAQWLDLCLQLTKGVGQAHNAKVFLIDLKENNVLLQGGGKNAACPFRPLVADYSLALFDTTKTQPDFGKGNLDNPHNFWRYPSYAPELSEQNEASAASDIYSLGVILQRIGAIVLAGRVPGLCYVAAECVRYDSESRPRISDVTQRLRQLRDAARRREKSNKGLEQWMI